MCEQCDRGEAELAQMIGIYNQTIWHLEQIIQSAEQYDPSFVALAIVAVRNARIKLRKIESPEFLH